MRTVHDVLGRKHIPEIDIDIYIPRRAIQPKTSLTVHTAVPSQLRLTFVKDMYVHSKKQLLRHLRLMLYKYMLKCLSCKTYPFSFFMRRIVEFASEDPHNDLEINSGSSMIEAQPSSFNDSFLVVLPPVRSCLTLLDGVFFVEP